jgi:hypothetical protein
MATANPPTAKAAPTPKVVAPVPKKPQAPVYTDYASI